MSNIWEEFYNKSSELLDDAFISEENLNSYHSFIEEFKEKVNEDEELSDMLESLLNEEVKFLNKDDNPLYWEHRKWIDGLYENCNEIDLTDVFKESLDITEDSEEDKEFDKELEELMQFSSDITLPDEVVLESIDIN